MLYWKYLQWDQTGSPKKLHSATTETKICWRKEEVCCAAGRRVHLWLGLRGNWK